MSKIWTVTIIEFYRITKREVHNVNVDLRRSIINNPKKGSTK